MMRSKNLLFIGLTMMVLLLAACGDKNKANGEVETDSKNFNESGMPIVNETIKLDVFAGKSATTADDWNDVLILNEYEKMTNIDITWNQVPADGLDRKTKPGIRLVEHYQIYSMAFLIFLLRIYRNTVSKGLL